MLYEPSSGQRERIAHLGMYTSFLHPLFPLCSHVIEKGQHLPQNALILEFMSLKNTTSIVHADRSHHPL